jgi:hypothetical protein
MNHDNISFVKSFIRILAGIALAWAGITYSSDYFIWAGFFIIVAEILGIAEELV